MNDENMLSIREIIQRLLEDDRQADTWFRKQVQQLMELGPKKPPASVRPDESVKGKDQR